MNLMKMMKQVAELKKLEKEMSRKTIEISSPDGMVQVVAQGDMRIKSITLNPSAVDPARADRLSKTLVSTINSALDSAKKAVAGEMSGRIPSDLGSLFGG